MHIRILFLSILLCCSATSFAQKFWKHTKDSCLPADLAQRTLYFPIMEYDQLPYNYEKAKKIFKRYYPYKYVFLSEDSLAEMNIDSLKNGYALRKEQVTREYTSSSDYRYGGSGYHSYQTYLYTFTKADEDQSEYEQIKLYSGVQHKTLQMIIRNMYYDIPSNWPKHCFKINWGVPITQYPRFGASYEYLIQRKTSLGVYMEAGAWNYANKFSQSHTRSAFVLFQPQLIRYFAIFKNHAYDGLFVGIAPFVFYSRDHLNPSDPFVAEYEERTVGYGIKGMLGFQFLIARKFIFGGWAGPQYRIGSPDNFTYENSFLTSVYPSLAPTAQVYLGFVLR